MCVFYVYLCICVWVWECMRLCVCVFVRMWDLFLFVYLCMYECILCVYYMCVFVFVAVYVHVYMGVCVCLCVFLFFSDILFVEDRFCRIKVFGRRYKIILVDFVIYIYASRCLSVSVFMSCVHVYYLGWNLFVLFCARMVKIFWSIKIGSS